LSTCCVLCYVFDDNSSAWFRQRWPLLSENLVQKEKVSHLLRNSPNIFICTLLNSYLNNRCQYAENCFYDETNNHTYDSILTQKELFTVCQRHWFSNFGVVIIIIL
jgi:hypothetical protein